jgi:hypothetical protein
MSYDAVWVLPFATLSAEERARLDETVMTAFADAVEIGAPVVRRRAVNYAVDFGGEQIGTFDVVDRGGRVTMESSTTDGDNREVWDRLVSRIDRVCKELGGTVEGDP